MKKVILTVLSILALNTLSIALPAKKISIRNDSIDPKLRSFKNDIFWKIVPWKDNSSLTVDGWGRYSVLSFNEKGFLRQKTLCEYPRERLDKFLYADCDTGFIYTTSSQMFHVYNADTNIKNSIIPVLSWKGYVSDLFPLDKNRLLIEFNMDEKTGYFVYEHSEKEFERPEITDWRNFNLIEQLSGDKNKFIACENTSDEMKRYFVYDWKKQKEGKNKLTDFLNAQNTTSADLFMKNQIASIIVEEKWGYILLWDKNFSNIKKINLEDYFENPDDISIFLRKVSGDGKYGFLTISFYSSEYRQQIYYLAFVDFERLRAGKENPVKVLDLFVGDTDLFFMTGFVPSEKDGQAFIFADNENKANAIYMKNIFEGGNIGVGISPDDDEDFEDIAVTGKPELPEDDEYAALSALLNGYDDDDEDYDDYLPPVTEKRFKEITAEIEKYESEIISKGEKNHNAKNDGYSYIHINGNTYLVSTLDPSPYIYIKLNDPKDSTHGVFLVSYSRPTKRAKFFLNLWRMKLEESEAVGYLERGCEDYEDICDEFKDDADFTATLKIAGRNYDVFFMDCEDEF